MHNRQARSARIAEIVKSVNDHKRLRALIREMACEMERLNEDNVQLRAALAIYSEVARRDMEKGGKAAPKVIEFTARGG